MALDDIVRKMKAPFIGKDRLLVSINTWDHEVIAREGEIFSVDMIAEVAALGRKNKLKLEKMDDTFFFEDCGRFLSKDSDMYPYLSKNPNVRKEVLKKISRVVVPKEVLSELRWMKKNFHYNYHHVIGVTVLMTQITIDFLWEQEDVLFCSELGLLFDLGLGKVPPEIIHKTSALTPRERRIVDQHPYYSALLTAYYYQDEYYRLISAIVGHHETLNGKGFPRGIRNADFISNILRACDLFDALVSDRPFRGIYTNEGAMDICLKEIKAKKILPDGFPLIFYYHLLTGKEFQRKAKK
jgi:HD-GYP domain-containing protein (c-di-GMP phosphodiesterase class II)